MEFKPFDSRQNSIFNAVKPLYNRVLPDVITEEFLVSKFGTRNVNIEFKNKPLRIIEGKLTYYKSDDSYARALLHNLIVEAKETKKVDKKTKDISVKTKVIIEPDKEDIISEEGINENMNLKITDFTWNQEFKTISADMSNLGFHNVPSRFSVKSGKHDKLYEFVQSLTTKDKANEVIQWEYISEDLGITAIIYND